MGELFLIIGFIAAIIIFIIGSSIFLATWNPKPKRTYIVIWRYDAMCPNTAVIVEAKSLAKAWEKVQKQHAIPIDLVSIEEI